MINKITIDGTKLATEKDFHQFLKKELEFPDYYGENLDALWDMLTAWIDLPLTVEWKYVAECKRKWGENRVEKILDVFREAEKELKRFQLISS